MKVKATAGVATVPAIATTANCTTTSTVTNALNISSPLEGVPSSTGAKYATPGVR